MKIIKQHFIVLILICGMAACTPEQVKEDFKADDPIGVPEADFNGTIDEAPETGDDQSIEPDNEKDG